MGAESSPRGAPAADARAVWAIVPGVLLAGIGGGLAFPILPAVGLRVGLPLAFIGAILAANRAARIVANPIVGYVADRFGGRRTLITGMLVQIVVMGLYWLGVVTPHPGAFFLVGRLLHGPGSSCIFVAGQALALHAGGARGGGQAGGILRGAMGIGVPVGLVLGGLLADAVGDATTFVLAAAAMAMAALGAFLLVPDLRVDLARRLPLSQALRGLADRRLAALGALNFAATFVGSGVVLTTVTLLVHGRALGAGRLPERTTASLLMGLLVVSEALSTPLLGRLGDKLRAHAWVATLGLVSTIPSLVLIAYATSATSTAVGMFLLGAGMGALGPSVLALVGALVDPRSRGLAAGGLQLWGDVGGAIGPLVGTAVLASSLALPYLLSAAVIAAFVPVAYWLTRVERRAV